MPEQAPPQPEETPTPPAPAPKKPEKEVPVIPVQKEIIPKPPTPAPASTETIQSVPAPVPSQQAPQKTTPPNPEVAPTPIQTPERTSPEPKKAVPLAPAPETPEVKPPVTPVPQQPTKPEPTPPPAPTPKTIEDKNLIASVLYLKNLLPESKSTVKFETVKEAEDSKKEDIISVIKERVSNTKQDITDLQKAGYNLHFETIKLITVPLKQKVWLATLKQKDLENIFRVLREVNAIILPLKKENEAKIAEKERLEKLEIQKQAALTTETPTSAPQQPPKPETQKQPTQHDNI
ncbi:hypothetical protein K8R30_02890 [archaeon]|nr:hypothetical protein [archaeon]